MTDGIEPIQVVTDNAISSAFERGVFEGVFDMLPL